MILAFDPSALLSAAMGYGNKESIMLCASRGSDAERFLSWQYIDMPSLVALRRTGQLRERVRRVRRQAAEHIHMTTARKIQIGLAQPFARRFDIPDGFIFEIATTDGGILSLFSCTEPPLDEMQLMDRVTNLMEKRRQVSLPAMAAPLVPAISFVSEARCEWLERMTAGGIPTSRIKQRIEFSVAVPTGEAPQDWGRPLLFWYRPRILGAETVRLATLPAVMGYVAKG